MSVFDFVKENLYESVGTNQDENINEEDSVSGDPQALVTGMIENAPDQKEQIGVLLKYAANTNPSYDVWDAALDYYESIADEAEEAGEEILDTGEDEAEANGEAENGDDPFADEEISDELPAEEPTDEEPVEDDEELSL